FLRGDPLTEDWTDEQVADIIRFKDPQYVCASITYTRYKGRYTHGTSFQLVEHDNYIAAGERFRRLAPGIKYLVYFHCFLDVTDDGPERFADARTLCPDGSQADYGEPDQRLYIPMTTNSYGAAVAKNVDVILDEIGADGVYWDEHEYSRSTYHFGEPWDGVSGNIDPSTMRVTQLKSSVTLLSEPWRLALAEYIQSRSPLVGNGAPVTKAMIARRFPCFVETGSITNCTQAHCYTPIALGDHLTERSELDAYGTMLAALDYGCVYHWYNDVTMIPTHHHLTRYMFPITPVELHEGYIVGEDRIVTNRNGLYGWGDASPHEAHVFDDTGREQEAFAAPLVTQDGKTYTELRIGEGWSAAILRK
ncbi:MAG: Carb-bd dom fam9 protein, partial [Candidatus Hydrogenedentes bacterium]|nr:Carb-bd dom fam9 protein [Candidatus Hydrogenedentota bacterium]